MIERFENIPEVPDIAKGVLFSSTPNDSELEPASRKITCVEESAWE